MSIKKQFTVILYYNKNLNYIKIKITWFNRNKNYNAKNNHKYTKKIT